MVGVCAGKEAAWYFDKREKRCKPFYYTGCGGNDNRSVGQTRDRVTLGGFFIQQNLDFFFLQVRESRGVRDYLSERLSSRD